MLNGRTTLLSDSRRSVNQTDARVVSGCIVPVLNHVKSVKASQNRWAVVASLKTIGSCPNGSLSTKDLLTDIRRHWVIRSNCEIQFACCIALNYVKMQQAGVVPRYSSTLTDVSDLPLSNFPRALGSYSVSYPINRSVSKYRLALLLARSWDQQR